MKRLHVHVGVEDLDQSISFYSILFGAQPTVTKSDYAKWMLDDPRVNFAISAGNHARKGIEHLGIQVESQDELGEAAHVLLRCPEGVLHAPFGLRVVEVPVVGDEQQGTRPVDQLLLQPGGATDAGGLREQIRRQPVRRPAQQVRQPGRLPSVRARSATPCAPRTRSPGAPPAAARPNR